MSRSPNGAPGRLPNLFVLGAQKSGSTLLCDRLSRHPECFVCSPKEPSHFIKPDYLDRLDEYRRLFAGANEAKFVADGSIMYVAHPYTAQRIRDVCGADTRGVVILRSPSQRALSGHMHLYKRLHDERTPEEVFGPLLGRPLDEALYLEEALLQRAIENRRVRLGSYGWYPDPRVPFRYLANSMYSRQMRPFLETFRADRLLILSAEHMRRNEQRFFEGLADALGISPFPPPPEKRKEQRNETKVPRARRALAPLHRWYSAPPLNTRSSSPVEKLLRAAYAATMFTHPPAQSATLREGLFALVQPEIDRFSALGPQARTVAESWGA